MIPPDYRIPVGLVLLFVAAMVIYLLYYQHELRNEQRRTENRPTKTFRQHVMTHKVHHISAVLVALAGVAVFLGVGVAVVLLHGGGATFNRHLRIKPHIITTPGQGGGSAVNLASYLPPIYDQGSSNACWSVATVEALYVAEHQRGATAMPAASNWRTFWYAAQPTGANATGTLDQGVAGVNSYGVEPLAYWPAQGPPDGTDPLHTTAYAGAKVAYLYYGQGYGRSAVQAIAQTIASGHVVAILWRVDQNALANGHPVIDDMGSFAFYHFSLAFATRQDSSGTAIELQNSWGSAWGIGGYAWMEQSTIEAEVLAASVISAGEPVPSWYPPRPTAAPSATKRPTARPTATPTRKPTPRPTMRPTATPAPVPRILIKAANMRASPATNGRILEGLAAGTPVEDLRRYTTHWADIRAGPLRGWIPRTAL